MSKNKSIKVYLFFIIVALFTGINLHARIGWTKAQCDKKYGESKHLGNDHHLSIFKDTKYEGRLTSYWYKIKGWDIEVKLWNDKVYYIHYRDSITVNLDTLVHNLIKKNGVQADFQKFIKWQNKNKWGYPSTEKPKLKYWFQFKPNSNFGFIVIYNQVIDNAIKNLIKKLKVSLSEGL